MNTCPYCNARPIAVTLCDQGGTYSMCDTCSAAWGTKMNAVEARCQVRVLEWWYSLPDAQEVRR